MRVLAGNVVTTAMVLACLNTIDANALRRLHPAIAAEVAAVPWADTTTPVRDVRRWCAALPAAVGCTLSRGCDDGDAACLPPTLRSLDVSHCHRMARFASLAHLAALESLDCSGVHGGMVGATRLPLSLRKLRMKYCGLDKAADFSHLRALQVLEYSSPTDPGSDCMISAATIASLPPSLEVLDIGCNSSTIYKWPPGGSFAHLTRLRVLRVARTCIDASALATFPPSLHSLELAACTGTRAATFAHLQCLRTLNASASEIGDAVLTTLPPSLVSLSLQYAGTDGRLTLAAVLPHLPALRVLNMSGTGLGDAAVASMPPGLVELRMGDCANVTQRASLDHLTALRVLRSSGTDVSPAAIALCRARGCVAPADGVVAREDTKHLISLPDGRLVGCICNGRVPCVVLWEAVHRAPPLAEVRIESPLSDVTALVALPDGHRVAIAVRASDSAPGGIVVWDTRDASQAARVVTAATIAFADGSQPSALAVLHDGHLAVGFANGKVRIVDVDASAVLASLNGHTHNVAALAVLPDGRLASGSWDTTVRVWDVDSRACVAKVVGGKHIVASLLALPDGRLASRSWDNMVLLWDVGRRICVGTLPAPTHDLAVLPHSNQLASVLGNNTLQVWDTRNAAGAPTLRLRHTMELVGAGAAILVPLPDGRLATGGAGVRLWQLPLDAAAL